MKNRNVTALCLAVCLGFSAAATIVTGCAGDNYKRSTGQYIDDKSLAYRVSSALHKDKEYRLNNVEVKAFRGNVQLSGFVNTEDQKREAGEISRTVPDVRSVENNIIVKSNLSQSEPRPATGP